MCSGLCRELRDSFTYATPPNSDGSLAGTDGCNRLTGSWSADVKTITFTDVAATSMMCEHVDTWLSEFATGTFEGETRTVRDGPGTEIDRHDRANKL